MEITIAFDSFSNDIESAEEPKKKPRRMGKEAFLKLSRGKKEKYLKIYPKSSHRFLLINRKKKVVDPNKPEFKRSTEIPAGKKPGTGLVPYKKQPGTDIVVHDDRITNKELAVTKKYLTDVEIVEEEEYKSGFKNFINKESVRSIQHITHDDMKAAGTAIALRQDDIIDAAFSSFEDKPTILAKGLNSVQKIFNGENINYKERKTATQVIATFAKYAMLAAGVVAIATASAPAAFIIARMMHESWGTLDAASGDKEIREKKKAEKQAQKERARKLEEYARTPEEKLKEELDSLKLMLKSHQISQRAYDVAVERLKNRAKRPAPKKKRETVDDDYDIYASSNENKDNELVPTATSLVRCIGDFIANIDLEELKSRAAGVYKGISTGAFEAPYLFASLRTSCLKAGCRVYPQNIKNGFTGFVPVDSTTDLIYLLDEELDKNGYKILESFISEGYFINHYTSTNNIISVILDKKRGKFSIRLFENKPDKMEMVDILKHIFGGNSA